MKFFFCIAAFFYCHIANAQRIEMPVAKFMQGDDNRFALPATDDSKWASIFPDESWEKHGYTDYDGYAWYRFHVNIPLSLKNNAYWKDSLHISLSKIDDVDEVFFNGKKIGQTGFFPSDPQGYQTAWNVNREYNVSAGNAVVHWDADNLIAIRVYDGGGPGGISGPVPFIKMLDIIDAISIKNRSAELKRISKNYSELTAFSSSELINQFNRKIEGTLITTSRNELDNTVKELQHQLVTLKPHEIKQLQISVPAKEGATINYTFIENSSMQKVSLQIALPYLLTPAPAAVPKINGAKTFGVKPNAPFFFKIPATGNKPLQYAVENLPEGIKLDADNGILTGSIGRKGNYELTFIVRNKMGTARRPFSIHCGDQLALTPPMGWNSWNCWGLSVSDEKVKASANAMISKGLIDHGWTYMNIDDGWEAAARNPDGSISPNKKFPAMKALGDYLHSKGLRFGIYSSPGEKTCGGFLGSYQHELMDAAAYNSWGIDYLKYDWCSYEDVYKAAADTSLAAYQKPYTVMKDALLQQPRDIVYSLCQYGMKDVWEWGETVNGNCWRTTGDINDSWESLSGIGFAQADHYHFAKPGRWNDPDMLIVGQVGWGPNLHPTRLTADEQYTHISLWCMLSAPLLLGCDLSKLDDFTLNLLTNDEVLAVDQDPLGKQAQQVIKTSSYQVWIKDLEDGTKALGIFNMSDHFDVIRFHWNQLGLGETQNVRDLWRQKDLGNFTGMFATKVPPHGVTLIRIKPIKN
ncbi:MAG: glycoside hydrolase family 27 protein [Ferruginibacter sp.]